MSLRFSPDGPEFPDELLSELMLGRVVFLCGAGVSVPQLPGFARLVERVYEDANIPRSRSEELSMVSSRFEEAMGVAARKVSDPRVVLDTVERILAKPVEPDLSNHRTLLRLSRAINNRVAIITTNFDTLFEHALREVDGLPAAQAESRSSPNLPSPGGGDFGGIIHLHGRIEDRELDLERTEWVLTSAQYGEAYLRAGWASRFLFDLARCRTIVLVGYSANDAPVRYLLNVLEADRDRLRIPGSWRSAFRDNRDQRSDMMAIRIPTSSRSVFRHDRDQHRGILAV